MNGELITIGDELLSGRVLNSNAAHIARALQAAGYELRWVTVVGDQQDDIAPAVIRALERAAFVLVTGGLGPTDDDRTAEAAARALGRSLRRDSQSWDILSEHLRKLNRPMTPEVARMADLPEGAKRIDLTGPRAGFYIEDTDKPLFFLPGVPDEMADMLTGFVLPTLRQRLPLQTAVRTRVLRIFGLRESEIARRLSQVKQSLPDLSLGYLPRFPENHLTLTVRGRKVHIDSVLDQAVQAISGQLGLYVYGQDEETLELVVGRLLADQAETLALAESCTGGLIAHLLTEVSGSSAYFDCSLVTYSAAAKIRQLHVPEETINRHGVVSAQTAESMVRGVQSVSGAGLALAVTGIAGPTGGSREIPVGTVFIALLYRAKLKVERFHFRGGRQQVKTLAAFTALDWMRRALIDASFFA